MSNQTSLQLWRTIDWGDKTADKQLISERNITS